MRNLLMNDDIEPQRKVQATWQTVSGILPKVRVPDSSKKEHIYDRSEKHAQQR